MRIFIAHADADQAVADELKGYILPNGGVFAQTETGARGFGYVQPSDVVIVLWSQACVFSPYRMQLEKRMLDAWADERLVLVRLDHSFLPVGMRDLPVIDASFETTRQITTWRDVTRAAKERMNALMVAHQARLDEVSDDEGTSDGSGQEGFELGLQTVPSANDPDKDPPEALFVSYAHADDFKVGAIVGLVENAGRAVWIDRGGIRAGHGWAGEIVRAIKSAGGALIMCSARAFESDHVKREIYLADRYKKPMLPVFLEEAVPPEDFEYFFAAVQWLELFRLPGDQHESAVARALESFAS
ncbi:MAG: hypothetical protein CME88_04865 [Hirschia sp.]|nr:hypothetical protein [Hirschia sp.]MBF17694.1 hypothetical protein [Hirschia sp.]